MILHKLCRLYDRLAADTDTAIAPLGYVVQGIAFELLITPAGDLIAINDLRVVIKNTVRNKEFILPGSAKPSGSGCNPSLHGWDTTEYMLGYLNLEGLSAPDAKKLAERCVKRHKAYKEGMLQSEAEVADPAYSAFCRFLEKWQPEAAANYPVLPDVSGLFGVVRIQGEQSYLHEIEAVVRLSAGAVGASTGICLLSGAAAEIARIHEVKIKGVLGAQSAGANLVSFNCDSFTSYGLTQSYNAPVSTVSAFKYATALNYLLAKGSPRRLQLGDATTVFWADKPSVGESIFGFVLSGEPPTDSALEEQIKASLRSLLAGSVPQALEGDTEFYVLGLAPNAARISVRFWQRSTLSELLHRVGALQAELQIVADKQSKKEYEFLSLRSILEQTARESKEIPPLLSGALLRAVLSGREYPLLLYQAVLRRLRVAKSVTYPRAAIIKAILLRNFKQKGLIMLEIEREEVEYQLGRLFAVLERLQEQAQGKVESGIKERFFSSASMTPASVFPRLLRLSQHHSAKLNAGLKINTEKQIQEICGRIREFPQHLCLQAQGLFALGYYHQRQDFFTKKEDAAAE